ncbi:MAG: type II toxin-antitoxin system VapC family toxin [Phototrophicaceae bacterium]
MTDYVIDTNTLSNLVKNPSGALQNRVNNTVSNGSKLWVSEAVQYEVERGLRKKGATKQLEVFRNQVLPTFSVVAVDWVTWDAAADLWVLAANKGRQLADVDLLVAALAIRLSAVIVSHDRDYDAFPSIPVEDWLK